jgi:hypothetical protein
MTHNRDEQSNNNSKWTPLGPEGIYIGMRQNMEQWI